MTSEINSSYEKLFGENSKENFKKTGLFFAENNIINGNRFSHKKGR